MVREVPPLESKKLAVFEISQFIHEINHRNWRGQEL